MPSTYPVIENDNTLGIDFSGYALCRALDQLDELSRKIEVMELSQCVYVDISEYSEFLDADVGLPDQQEWFEANKGLLTVSKLLENLDTTFDKFDGLRTDLADLMKVLEQAETSGSGWRLEHDI